MLIVSQNGEKMVNFDNVNMIIVRENSIVSFDNTYTDNQDGDLLGIYKNKERAKEVLKEIQERYEHMQYLKCFNRLNDLYEVGIKDFAYEMPKE